jgi:serine protease Do
MVAIETTTTAPVALGEGFAQAAEALRRATVQVRGRGPGSGSGVIWSADGVIITNAHVAHSSQAEVELWDGRILPAEVTRRDEERDLAELHVQATNLPAALIGDSDALRVGELVLAMGNPLGIIGALTTGIVHAATTDGSKGRPWVQADVRLAPGNSGGPLADAQGRVIGINSMIAGGLALAVPSNAVVRFLAGKAERPMLGVALRPVQLEANRLGLLIFGVVPDSAAAMGGIIIGDIITGVAGQPLTTPEDFAAAMTGTAKGAPLRLDLLRGGQTLSVVVTITDAAPGVVAA